MDALQTRKILDNLWFDRHTAGYMSERGWSKSLVRQTIEHPHKVIMTADTRINPRQPAKAYFLDDTHYVVVNDLTANVVQLSNRNSSIWKFTPRWYP